MLLKTLTKINKMQPSKFELWVISFCKTKGVYITCQSIFLSHPLRHPHNSVHFSFCFLQRQYFMQLNLMSSLQAWDASAIVVQIYSIPSWLSFCPHSSLYISSDHFLFELHHYIFVPITFFVHIIFFVRIIFFVCIAAKHE